MHEEHLCDWRLRKELQLYCCFLTCKTLGLRWILQLNVSHFTTISLNIGGQWAAEDGYGDIKIQDLYKD